jgi:hypothetical protein
MEATMSEQVYDGRDGELDGTTPAPAPVANGELVHWMDRPPLKVGAAGVSLTAGAAFTLGVVTAVGVLALAHWLGPDRVVEVRRARRV